MMGNRTSSGRVDETQTIPNDLERLENLDDWEIADDETDPRGFDLIGAGGEKVGTIDSLLASPSTQKAHFAVVDADDTLAEQRFLVPLDRVTFQDNRAFAPYSKAQVASGPSSRDGERDYSRFHAYWTGLDRTSQGTDAAGRQTGAEYRVPLTEEAVDVQKTARQTGYITLRKRTQTVTQRVSEPLNKMEVSVETREVPPGEAREVEANANVLREGQTLRVPMVEEELEVSKEPRVTREAVIRAQPRTEMVERDVQLHREVLDIDGEGDVDLADESKAAERR